MKQGRTNVLSIVLPCFNERAAVRPLVEGLIRRWEVLRAAASVDDLEIIVVDDGSNDGSAEELAGFSGWARILRHPQRRGYGAALKSGFAAATGEFVAFLDLDMTYEPLDLGPMLADLRARDLAVVIGNRLHDMRGMPLTRRVGNFLFRATIQASFGRQVADSCSGIRIVRASYLRYFQQGLPDQLNYSLAMTLATLRLGLPFAESPIRYYRRLGESKLNVLRDGLAFFWTIFLYRMGWGGGLRAPVALGATPE